MATKKDLVEAYSFSRRRLVTAFVSGAPGGREVEPARPGRTVVGGLALAVLLVAGAAIAGVFAPTAPTDWKDPGLIISTGDGAAYVITEESDDPELQPVINSTSAKLILGADNATPTMLDQDTIDDQRIGDEIGILGASASLPTSSRLIDSGWTACTADHTGIRVTISESPDVVVPPETLGVTVENNGHLYVVVPTEDDAGLAAGAYLYPVPPQKTGDGGTRTDTLLSALGLQTSASAVHVGRDWLNLFPTGAALDWSSFHIVDAGQRAPYGDAADDLQYGDLVETADGPDLLITDDGPLQLSEFESAVYRNVVDDDRNVVVPKQSDAPPTEYAPDDTLDPAHWPEQVPADSMPVPCAQLIAEHDQAPVARLVMPVDPDSSADLEPGLKDQVVDLGRGAYVLSGGWADTDRGSPYVIDSNGGANPLVDEDTAELLGYGDFPVVVVPDTWIKLFACGVNLSREAALLPPDSSDQATSCGND